MNKKSVLFVLPSLDPGGAEYQTIDICNVLQNEYEVYLLILSGDGPLSKDIQLSPQNIFVLGSPFSVVSFKNVSFKIFFSTIRDIAVLIKDHEIETVMANLPISHFLLRITKFLFPFRKFKLVNVHHSQQFKARQRSLGKKIFDRFNNLLSLMVDNLNIFVSKASLKDSFEHFYYQRSKIKVIHNGSKIPNELKISDPFMKIRNHKESYSIVLAGRLVQEKGHLFFLKAIEKLVYNKKISNTIELYIIGDGPLSETIYNFVHDSSLENIHLLGQKPKDELPQYFSAADLVVIPSLSEGFGLIAVEAIFSGATVLASDTGGLKEIISDGINGFSFKSNDPDSLQEHMIQIVNNGMKVDIEQAKDHTKKEFAFDVMLNKYKKVIDGTK